MDLNKKKVSTIASQLKRSTGHIILPWRSPNSSFSNSICGTASTIDLTSQANPTYFPSYTRKQQDSIISTNSPPSQTSVYISEIAKPYYVSDYETERSSCLTPENENIQFSVNTLERLRELYNHFESQIEAEQCRQLYSCAQSDTLCSRRENFLHTHPLTCREALCHNSLSLSHVATKLAEKTNKLNAWHQLLTVAVIKLNEEEDLIKQKSITLTNEFLHLNKEKEKAKEQQKNIEILRELQIQEQTDLILFKTTTQKKQVEEEKRLNHILNEINDGIKQNRELMSQLHKQTRSICHIHNSSFIDNNSKIIDSKPIVYTNNKPISSVLNSLDDPTSYLTSQNTSQKLGHQINLKTSDTSSLKSSSENPLSIISVSDSSIQVNLEQDQLLTLQLKMNELTTTLQETKLEYNTQQYIWIQEKQELQDTIQSHLADSATKMTHMDNKFAKKEQSMQLQLNNALILNEKLQQTNKQLLEEIKQQNDQLNHFKNESLTHNVIQTPVIPNVDINHRSNEEVVMFQRREKFLEEELAKAKNDLSMTIVELDQAKLDLMRRMTLTDYDTDLSEGTPRSDTLLFSGESLWESLEANDTPPSQITRSLSHDEDLQLINTSLRKELERIRRAMGEQEHEVLTLTFELRDAQKQKDNFEQKYKSLSAQTAHSRLMSRTLLELKQAGDGQTCNNDVLINKQTDIQLLPSVIARLASTRRETVETDMSHYSIIPMNLSSSMIEDERFRNRAIIDDKNQSTLPTDVSTLSFSETNDRLINTSSISSHHIIKSQEKVPLKTPYPFSNAIPLTSDSIIQACKPSVVSEKNATQNVVIRGKPGGPPPSHLQSQSQLHNDLKSDTANSNKKEPKKRLETIDKTSGSIRSNQRKSTGFVTGKMKFISKTKHHTMIEENDGQDHTLPSSFDNQLIKTKTPQSITQPKFSKADMFKKKLIMKKPPSLLLKQTTDVLNKQTTPDFSKQVLPVIVRDLFPIYEDLEMLYLATDVVSRAKLFKSLVLQLQTSQRTMEELLDQQQQVKKIKDQLLSKTTESQKLRTDLATIRIKCIDLETHITRLLNENKLLTTTLANAHEQVEQILTSVPETIEPLCRSLWLMTLSSKSQIGIDHDITDGFAIRRAGSPTPLPRIAAALPSFVSRDSLNSLKVPPPRQTSMPNVDDMPSNPPTLLPMESASDIVLNRRNKRSLTAAELGALRSESLTDTLDVINAATSLPRRPSMVNLDAKPERKAPVARHSFIISQSKEPGDMPLGLAERFKNIHPA